MSQYAVMPLEHYDNACDKVREHLKITDKIASGSLPEKVDDVYEAGKKSQYDEFWDTFQNQGTATNYTACFGGSNWKNGLLNPKYDVVAVNASYMFYYNSMSGDLVEYFDGIGKKLNLEQCDNVNSTFQYSSFTRVPKIYCSSDGWYSTFYGCSKLITIDEAGTVDENDDVFFSSNTFHTCSALENIKIRGKIVRSTSFQWSTKLSKASWISIITALSAATTGLSIIGSLESVNTAFETSAGAKDGSTSAEWLNLIATKSNWTISLV